MSTTTTTTTTATRSTPRRKSARPFTASRAAALTARKARLKADLNGLITYGLKYPPDHPPKNQLEVEARAFVEDPGGGLGRVEHFKNFVFDGWSDTPNQWQEWLDRMVGSLTRNTNVERVGEKVIRATTWTGCAASGKTWLSALYALIWWTVSPHNSIAVLTSTTKDMIRKKMWSVIRNFTDTHFSRLLQVKLGWNTVDTPMMIRWQPPESRSGPDAKHALFALAVADGETRTAIAKMSGLHAERMLLIVDECDGTPESIFATIPNMAKGCRDFTLLFIANPKSHLDAHGRLAEPLNGWKSISVDDETWITKGVKEWGIPAGLCEHFDGFRSPNVRLERTRYRHIYAYEDYLSAKGDLEREKHLAYWAQDRGFWAGEGVTNTIFTESMLVRCGGYEQVEWLTPPTVLAFLDPAFGGDDCTVVFGECGTTIRGTKALLITEKLVLNPHGTGEMEYVIAREYKSVCEERGVQPGQAGVDANGTGRGVAAVLATEWSPLVQKLDSQGAVSELPVSGEDATPAKEVYDRAITEHWFMGRHLLQSGMLKGVYAEAAVQFTTREYERKGKKYRLSTKAEHKQRLGRSPDDADCIIGLCRLAQDVCGLYPENSSSFKGAEPDNGTRIAYLVEGGEEPERGYQEPPELSGMYR